nr:hypothetical protein CFP56_70391 [Quercus suber]
MTTTTTATKLSPPTLDLRTPATLPIRLGPSILDPSAGALTSVRYNHKPSLSPRTGPASISRGQAGGATELSFPVRDGQEYLYSGASGDPSDVFVLLPRGREMLLERLSSAHAFNLLRGPDEKDAGTLGKQYPQINLDEENDESGDEVEGGLFGEDDDGEEAEVDPANPFDWRNYLNKEGGMQEESPAQPPKKVDRKVERKVAPSAAPTKKRKQPPVKEKATAKRVKASEEPFPAKAKPQRASRPAPPEIRLDRKASIRRSTVDVDDSGELILEDDESTAATTKPSAMSLALSGHLGDGPVSLRSVASSPAASRFASTSPGHVPGPSPPDDGEEIDLDPGSGDDAGNDDDDDDDNNGGAQSSAPADPSVVTYHFDDFDGDDDEADADVEDLELPSPAQAHHPSVSAATVTPAAAATVEDDDDLGEALALALGENDDENGGAPLAHESDEESEEE